MESEHGNLEEAAMRLCPGLRIPGSKYTFHVPLPWPGTLTAPCKDTSRSVIFSLDCSVNSLGVAVGIVVNCKYIMFSP